MRTKQNQISRAKELQQLEKLIQHIPQQKMWLQISYEMDGQIYTDHLQQCEIYPSKETIKKIRRAQIIGYRKTPIVLTTIRAKQLIREIKKFNIKINSN